MNKGGGWVKLYRGLLEDFLFLEADPLQVKTMITLLLLANHAPKNWEWKGEKYQLNPGQLITSIDKLVLKVGKGATKQRIRTALKNLEKHKFLTNESTKRGRLVTLTNWAAYQSEGADLTNKLTDTQQTLNKDLTPNKKERKKEGKKEEARAGHFGLFDSLINYFESCPEVLTTCLQMAEFKGDKKTLISIMLKFASFYFGKVPANSSGAKLAALFQKWIITEVERNPALSKPAIKAQYYKPK